MVVASSALESWPSQLECAALTYQCVPARHRLDSPARPRAQTTCSPKYPLSLSSWLQTRLHHFCQLSSPCPTGTAHQSEHMKHQLPCMPTLLVGHWKTQPR